jgi:uncharacterized membrane protein YdjX (TVP38/TMEM64 family)
MLFSTLDQIILLFETVHPLVFVLGLILLPLVPIPVSPVWVLAGMRFGPAVAITMSAACLVGNFAIAHLLSARLFHASIEQMLVKRKFKVPQVKPEDQAMFCLMIRLFPGMPLFIQNYLLGVVRVNFGLYVLIGLPVQLLYATGFILFGEALFEGRTGMLVFAVLFMVVLVIAVKLLGKRYMASQKAKSFEILDD